MQDFPVLEVLIARVEPHGTWSFRCLLDDLHGGWDADNWDLRYSMLKNTGRPKFDINIKHVERFSVLPVYRVSDGIEFRVLDSVKLSDQALVQELRTIDGFQFFSPPKDIIVQLLHALAERYISHYDKPKPIDENSKHMIDARAVFTKEESDGLIVRFNEKAKIVADHKNSKK